MRERFVRAIPTTFGVHLAQTILAVLAASVWSAGFVAAFGGHPGGVDALRDGGPIAVESISAFLKVHARWGFVYTLAVGVGWWVASIPIQMLWLHAHEQRLDRASMAGALRRSVPAIGASLLMLLPLVLVVAALVALPWSWVAFTGAEPDARVVDIGFALACIPGAFLWLFWSAWFDVTRAAVALGLGPVEAMRAAWRVRAGHVYFGWWVVGLTLSLVAVGIGGPGWWILIGAQIALLVRTYVRSAWWACALSRMQRLLEPREGNHVRTT